MAQRWFAVVSFTFATCVLTFTHHAHTQPGAAVPDKSADLEAVQKVLAARREYQKALEQLYVHYNQVNDKERERWAKEELVQFHRIPKHAYILDLDVPPPNLQGNVSVPEANKLFTWALQYKDKGFGADHIDNQRRAELLFQEILTKYPNSDKISDVAFMLGDIYESKPYKMHYRAVEYYHRCYQWNSKTSHDARLRAARIYDKHLNNRTKALEMYREVVKHDVIDLRRKQEAERRIADLTGTK